MKELSRAATRRTRTPLSTPVAVLALATTTACAPDATSVPVVTELLPYASSAAPLSATFGIALVSEEIACVINSYESRIHCVDRSDGGVAVFGREGEGPGEFDGLSSIERGPDGQVVAIDVGSARMTYFELDGTVVSETPLPPLFQPSQLRGGRLFGVKVGLPDFASGETQPTYVPMVIDASSGEVLWERTDLPGAVGRECFSGAVGTSTPAGGLVFEACGNELAFLADRDAPSAIVAASPNYVETLPNDRDVGEQMELITGVGRYGGMPDSAIAARVAEFRAKPKDWILKRDAFGFDHRDRLWVATTHDHDAYSYFDVWTDTVYAGAARVRDRLMSFDIFGSTLVTLAERTPGADGIGELAIDWYDLGEVADVP
ncbi:MAG: hypothetical protein F4123_01005 [Gemmatimonadetes bacterium]|nr:hypothetical protein [Gemmatimonadota bacterium]MYB98209.1 hypothetical protein [Gemmatimonadota bacterium]MYI44970.1 hypothetical protein [Gemmatimonadota bacterium]